MARTDPMMASLSPAGISSQDKVTSENMRLGSGVKGRTIACLPFANDAVIHPGLTTGIICRNASVYSGKSLVAEIICVTTLRSMEPLSKTCTTPPFSSRDSRF